MIVYMMHMNTVLHIQLKQVQCVLYNLVQLYVICESGGWC